MSRQKNILVLTSTYPRWDGDDTPAFVADFAHHLSLKLDNVYVLAPHFLGAKHFESHDAVHVKRIHYFIPGGETIFYGGGGITKIKKTPLYAIKLLGYLSSLFFNTLCIALRRDVAVINAHWLIPQGFIAVLVKLAIGKPVALTVHGADILSLNGKYMRIIKRFVLRNADIVYVNSGVTKAACETILKRDYLIVPMGIDLQTFQKAKPSSSLTKKYQLAEFTILFVGRLMETKGVIYLLEAVQLLKKSGRNFTAIIVGSGPLETELKTFVSTHDLQKEIIFEGWVTPSKLPSYYATASVFVGPSLYEAQGLVFVEALASGTPVITTAGNGPDDFVENGVNGYLVRAKSAQQLFDRLRELYDNPNLLKSMRSQAPRSVAQTFSWESTTNSYLKSWRRFL